MSLLKWLREIFGIRKENNISKEDTQTTITPSIEEKKVAPQSKPSATDNYKSTGQRQSRRGADMAAEAELASFLDEYLYAPLLAEGHFETIRRVFEKEQQLKGVDVVVSTGKTIGNIDEKAQIYYVNKNLPTFAFELQFLKYGEVIEGWFLNDRLCTDYYLLIWPQATTDNIYELTKDKFTCLDALMISKNKLRMRLEELGLSKEVLTNKAVELRRNRAYGKTATGHKGIYYYLSDSRKYVEAPINIVISKSILQEIASAHYAVTPKGFKRIKKSTEA